jgi:hypothetical protein
MAIDGPELRPALSSDAMGSTKATHRSCRLVLQDKAGTRLLSTLVGNAAVRQATVIYRGGFVPFIAAAPHSGRVQIL